MRRYSDSAACNDDDDGDDGNCDHDYEVVRRTKSSIVKRTGRHRQQRSLANGGRLHLLVLYVSVAVLVRFSTST